MAHLVTTLATADLALSVYAPAAGATTEELMNGARHANPAAALLYEASQRRPGPYPARCSSPARVGASRYDLTLRSPSSQLDPEPSH
jgi:hypothetical protein